MPDPKPAPTSTLAAAAAVLVLALTLPLAYVRGQAPAGGEASDAQVLAQAQGEADGWFTEEQADRGEEAYQEHCAECHSPDLQARSTYISLYNYPALTGAYFMDRWEGQNVRTLFEVIRQTMPLDAPNSLEANTYADITAHILRVNGFPSGDRELPPAIMDGARLEGMILEPAAMEEGAQPQNPEVVELRTREDGDAEPAGEEAAPDEGDEPPPADEGEPSEASEDDGDDGASQEDGEGADGDGDEDGGASPTADGEALYANHCAQCHGEEGQGGVGPALAGNDFLADADAAIDQTLHGGGGMPAFRDTLSNDEIAAVVSHVRTAWDNDFGEVSVDRVEERAEASDGDGDGEAQVDEEPTPWYAEEQASRGRVAFVEHCARCHGRALQGTGAAPSLAGGNFIDRWAGETLSDLYWVASALMPLDDPGSLDPDTYTDLVAYVLEQNGFEAGDQELPTDATALERYVIRPDHADVPDVP